MIQSMTGYGKSEVILNEGKLSIEIRSVNGKSADINIKSTILPKDKEMEVRKRLSEKLQRGSIDLFFTWESGNGENIKHINKEAAMGYFAQIQELASEMGSPNIGLDSKAVSEIISTILRIPDVMEAGRKEIINDNNWCEVSSAIDQAIEQICNYRTLEGEALYKDITGRVHNILSLYDQVEELESERIDAVKERLSKALAELQIHTDKERFEQEMIFYLEKYDINEEKVRLRQHCKYFLDTIDTEAFPGKKLGFILQEMGREINTTGSKANHAGIQKLVVKMKDELEKMKEQSLNIL